MEELNILYEDNHIIVVLKPQNVPTCEDDSKDPDLLNMVKDYIKVTYNKPGNVYVGLVHRLDRPTGGVMVFAKSSKAAARLSEGMKTGDFEKKYLAVLVGTPKEKKAVLTHY
ncbi:MAG: RNA pseudouridine synthase, partial [Clostridia bacterium]|nr:RNA pseudouridine synthase [Clostridia bacterium]